MSEKKIQRYHSENITVQYDPNICSHAAECVKGSPKVFDVKARPWVQPANDGVEAVKNTIHKCPSGALTYELPDGTVYSGPEK